MDIPLSVYLGWISVATIANISDWLYSVNWNGFGIDPQAWAVIILVVASLIGLLMAFTRRDSGYLFVFVWAFAGIAVKQAGAPLVVDSALVRGADRTGAWRYMPSFSVGGYQRNSANSPFGGLRKIAFCMKIHPSFIS